MGVVLLPWLEVDQYPRVYDSICAGLQEKDVLGMASLRSTVVLPSAPAERASTVLRRCSVDIGTGCLCVGPKPDRGACSIGPTS
jgi:hypothetical protein